ncbi:MAG: NAD-dependent epimerase/dehydratase family protein [Nitrospirae bacterium]|nr:NAD-dependent epimerase/dehydratase family protein [Nitrospirota bacterium]
MSVILEADVRQVVERVGNAFRRLSGRSLLLAGGTGFVGTHLLETLAYLNDRVLDRPCRVVAVARHPESFSRKCPRLAHRRDIQWVKGDIRSFHPPRGPWSFIVHAGAPSDPKKLKGNPQEVMDVIAAGTRRLLEFASEKETEAFLFLSSGAVYGPQPPQLDSLPETYQGGPDTRNGRSGYGEAKRYAEVLCQACLESKGIPIVVARLFTFVGPHMDLDAGFAVTDFVRQGLRDRVIRIQGDGRAIRTLCYSADMTVAIWKILLSGRKGQAYNVGSDLERISIEELAGKVAGIIGLRCRIRVERKGGGDFLRPRYVPDITKLKSELGFSLHHDLDLSLRRTIEHVREKAAT